jgi:hypothetical protein
MSSLDSSIAYGFLLIFSLILSSSPDTASQNLLHHFWLVESLLFIVVSSSSNSIGQLSISVIVLSTVAISVLSTVAISVLSVFLTIFSTHLFVLFVFWVNIVLLVVFLAISQAGERRLNGLNIHHSAAALPHLNKSSHCGFSFTVISAALVTIFCNHSSSHSSSELHA